MILVVEKVPEKYYGQMEIKQQSSAIVYVDTYIQLFRFATQRHGLQLLGLYNGEEH